MKHTLPALIAALSIALGNGFLRQPASAFAADEPASTFACASPYVIDGDTLQCSHGPRVRLARIDAPEMPGHCRPGRNCAPGDPFEAKAALVEVIGRRDLDCVPVSASPRGGPAVDRYGRTVARCSVNGTDLGEYMIAGGFAIVWPRE